jgi:hypothetical protein
MKLPQLILFIIPIFPHITVQLSIHAIAYNDFNHFPEFEIEIPYRN